MTELQRLDYERLFHDRQAAERAERFAARREDLRFDDAEYLDHETWIRPAFQKLGNLVGKSVLDLGCGHGMASVVLARAGAIVTGVDLSPGYIAEAQARARANGIPATFQAGDAERLPFDDQSFDAIWGCAILHHLEIPVAANEIRRLMKPGGIAVLCEPWGGNPALAWGRRCLPYRGKHRTPDEKPLTEDDVTAVREVFPDLEIRGFQLLGMVRRLWSVRRSRYWNWLDGIDRRLMRIFPALEKRGRYVVLVLRKG